jgi:UMF1 family MFS transporter
MGRGALIMSNIFLSTSLIYLASEEAGCLDDELTVVEDCNTRVYGMLPVALIANIAVVSGLLSAFLMPLTGAAVDYTPHRRKIGMYSAALVILIQAIQIGTLPKTWFAMSVLQGFSGFLFQVQVLATYAYFPVIARAVGEATMTHCEYFNLQVDDDACLLYANLTTSFFPRIYIVSASFTMVQFSSQALFLVVVIALSLAIGLNDVQTGQLSQGLNACFSGLAFYIGWRILPSAPATHELPANKTLFTQSFTQVWQTTKSMNNNYGKSLRWFFLGLIFAESASNAFTLVAVIFLNDQLGMTGTEIGIFFLVTLVATLPGSRIGAIITSRTNPNISWRLSMAFLMTTAIAGAFILDKGMNIVAYVWGVVIGLGLGWFYPVENLVFSMLLPKGQEAELSGFYVYCTQILGWLPPLIFSIMVENSIHQKYGILVVTSFFAVAIALLSMLRWTEALEEVRGSEDTSIKKEKDVEDYPVEPHGSVLQVE